MMMTHSQVKGDMSVRNCFSDEEVSSNEKLWWRKGKGKNNIIFIICNLMNLTNECIKD